MDSDVYYDIPIFSSLPSIIREPADTPLFKKEKLNKISIIDIYELEPFNNKNNNSNIIIISIIVLSFYLLIFLLTKSNK